MNAIIKGYNVSSLVSATGIECNTALQATAMLLVVPPNFSFTLTDLEQPLVWAKSKINAPKTGRMYPMFGQLAPIREIESKQPNDSIVTLDDGLQVFLRYGFYNRTFGTTSGGMGFAKALQTFNASGYRIIEIDKQGQMLARDNGDGTFGGLITDFMYAPSPTMADLKTNPFKNHFTISYSPTEVYQNGVVFANAGQLLTLQGLVQAQVVQASGQASPTDSAIIVNVQTALANTDLLAQISASWGDPTKYIVTDLTLGTVLPITSASFSAASGSTPAYVTINLTSAATPGNTIQVALKDVSQLGAPFYGYDYSVPFTFVAP